jgi:predicted DNA-binding ribbon-helix-helix protein
MEAIFWEALKAEVKAEGISLAALIVRIDETRTGNLSSALRVYVMEVLKKKLP